MKNQKVTQKQIDELKEIGNMYHRRNHHLLYCMIDILGEEYSDDVTQKFYSTLHWMIWCFMKEDGNHHLRGLYGKKATKYITSDQFRIDCDVMVHNNAKWVIRNVMDQVGEIGIGKYFEDYMKGEQLVYITKDYYKQ